jgi:hypothetical protein
MAAPRRQWRFIVVPLLTASAVLAADDSKFMKLEQDVRNLERRVGDLTREIEDLQQQLTRAGERPPGRSRPAPASPSSGWLNVDSWNRVRIGMSELEVIGLLGPPTSMRDDDGGRVLLYAMEIGSSGFLGGSVTLRDRQVTEVSPPVLK